MTTVHSLTPSMVDMLGDGFGDAETIHRLRAAQVSKRLLLLRTLLDEAPSPRLDDYFALLVEAQRRAPDTVAGVLAEPHVGAWLASSLRRLRVYAGYAGWAPGQLDGEVDEGAWIIESAQPDDPFRDGDMWSEALRRKGGRYRLLATMPADPAMN